MKIHNAFRIGLVGTLGVGVGLLILMSIASLSTIIAYIGAALFLALGLDPAISWLERRGLPRWSAILIVMTFVVLSYREVVMVYIRPGGSYVVARENFGPRIAQICAVALLIDYVVTVAVQVAAGTAAQADFALEVALSEQVTVTALKREETVFNVPFSIAAPTEEVLRGRGVQDIEGVAANVGGFTVQNLGPGQSQVAMRGVSSGQIVRDQPGVKEQVGVYLDESVISLSLFTPDIDLYDLNRVETLRGPQGTLFGSGSVGGTIRYITNQPKLGVTEGSVEANLNLVDGDDLGGHLKGAINVPMGDKAALRGRRDGRELRWRRRPRRRGDFSSSSRRSSMRSCSPASSARSSSSPSGSRRGR